MAAVFRFPPSSASSGDGSPIKPSAQQQTNTAMDTAFEMMNVKGNNQGLVITVQEAPRAAATHVMPSVIIEPPSPLTGSVTPPAGTPSARSTTERISPPPTVPAPPIIAQRIRPPKRALTIVTGHSPSPLRMSTYPNPSTTRPTSPEQSSTIQHWNRSSPTLVRKSSLGSTGTHSPVMRSMFPRYNPIVPLARQNYAPTTEPAMGSAAWQAGPSDQQAQSPTSYSSPESPLIPARSNWSNTRLGSGGMKRSPLRVSETPPPNLSTPEELLDMWSIANGQGSLEAAEIYTLGLLCDDLVPEQESLSFTSTARTMYNLHATSSALTITRTHPMTPSPPTTITTTTIFTPTSTSPLTASIFPKLAEIMAIEQATSIAQSHHLDDHDASDLRAEALRRTRAAEAANLLWDSDSARYYLIHPTLNDGEPTTFPFDIDAALSNIRLLASNTPGAPVLLSLSLETNTLIIHTQAITAPDALYVLDTLLAATLTLLLHLHRTTVSAPLPIIPSPAPTFHFAPPPTTAFPTFKTKSKSLRSKPRSTSSRAHTPSHTLFESQILSPSQTLDVEKGMTIAPELHHSTGVDLSRFQAYDLHDPELSTATRGALRVLYWLFGCMVWMLGVCVGVLAAGIVAVGGCIRRV
ncbi:hypothetical protein MMC13_004689 [Lambiella insularis]|nr:hypothetical protein [Lambiella insularis]